MIYVETANQGDSVEKKRYKKLKYLPVTQLEHFLAGQLDFESDWEEMGCFQQQTMASVRREEEETRPFQVGTYYYKEGNGLYIIAAYEKTEYEELLEDLLDAVSLTGIGGKKSSGMGKFQLIKEKNISEWKRYLTQESDRYILLSSALPRDEELENALEHASYLLSKRSGFVASERYADEWRKKKDLYVFTAGSCFQNRFQGDIFDVSMGGNHPVYRYAKPLFMGVQVK
jgi:CRISPR-associated protein Csm4